MILMKEDSIVKRKTLKKELRRKVEEELSDTQCCNLKITIDDYYITLKQ